MPEPETRAMATIAGAVALGAAFTPRRLLRTFGVAPEEVTGATRLALGLFATRNAYLATRALRGDEAAVAAFLPLQALDQLVFWRAFADRSAPRAGMLLAAATSGVIVGLDVRRRARGGRQAGAGAPVIAR